MLYPRYNSFFNDFFKEFDELFSMFPRYSIKVERKPSLPMKKEPRKNALEKHIEKVIARGPALTVFWKDGTKTTVKTHNEETFDYEKGLAMAFMKKFFGENKYDNYFEDMKEIMEKYPYENSKETKAIEEKKEKEIVIPESFKKAKKVKETVK